MFGREDFGSILFGTKVIFRIICNIFTTIPLNINCVKDPKIGNIPPFTVGCVETARNVNNKPMIYRPL